jgi:hypothetical protein
VARERTGDAQIEAAHLPCFSGHLTQRHSEREPVASWRIGPTLLLGSQRPPGPATWGALVDVEPVMTALGLGVGYRVIRTHGASCLDPVPFG